MQAVVADSTVDAALDVIVIANLPYEPMLRRSAQLDQHTLSDFLKKLYIDGALRRPMYCFRYRYLNL
jgi:hypothetical protein